MDMYSVATESGRVIATKYERALANQDSGIKVKNVVSDIYRNLPDFNEPIYWINSVKVEKEGKTIADVLDEFTQLDQFKEKFIMCQADSISDVPASGTITDVLEIVESHRGYIIEAYFYNIFFNRKMSLTYGNPYICIYSNTLTEDWIKNNMGEDKIINRVVASSKVS